MPSDNYSGRVCSALRPRRNLSGPAGTPGDLCDVTRPSVRHQREHGAHQQSAAAGALMNIARGVSSARRLAAPPETAAAKFRPLPGRRGLKSDVGSTSCAELRRPAADGSGSRSTPPTHLRQSRAITGSYNTGRQASALGGATRAARDEQRITNPVGLRRELLARSQ